MGWVIGRGIGIVWRTGGTSWDTSWSYLIPMPLLAYGTSETTIDLSITDVFSGDAKLVWYKSTDGVTYTSFSTTAKGIVTTQATGLTSGTLYYFRVRAEQGTNYSAWSNVTSTATWVTQYTAVYNAVVGTKPSDQVSDAQNYFIWYLQGNNSDARNTWDKIACIIPYCAGMPTSADALMWWNDTTRAATLGGANPPTYTVGQGFTGTANGYIDTGFNPSADGGVLYTQNNCTNSWYFYNNRTTGADKINGLTGGGVGIQLAVKYTDDNLYYRQQGDYAAISGGKNTNNLFTAVRLNSTQQQLYVNRDGLGLDNSNSSALADEAVNDLCEKTVGGGRASFSDDTISLRIFASGLDGTDITIICDAFDTLLFSIQSKVAIMSDACDGVVIDTDKWDVANSDVTVATFEQNNELIMNSLKTGTGATEYYLNMITSDISQLWGVWKFSVLSILTEGATGYSQIGLRTIKTSDGWIIGFSNDAPENISFVIKNGAAAADYLVANAFEYFAIVKMIVTPTKKVQIYMWVNDGWVQIGVDKNYTLGALYLYMATRGYTPMKTSIRDVYITKYDYSTVNPV